MRLQSVVPLLMLLLSVTTELRERFAKAACVSVLHMNLLNLEEKFHAVA